MTTSEEYFERWLDKKCCQCGKPNDRYPSWHCSKCLTKTNKAKKEWVKKRIANGKCKCGAELPEGRRTCSKCSKEVSKMNIKRRRERIALGLCGECGKKPLHTKTMCFECNLKFKKRQERFYSKEV